MKTTKYMIDPKSKSPYVVDDGFGLPASARKVDLQQLQNEVVNFNDIFPPDTFAKRFRRHNENFDKPLTFYRIYEKGIQGIMVQVDAWGYPGERWFLEEILE